MKSITYQLQDYCGNTASTYSTLAELREELLSVNDIDEVATCEQAYDSTCDIVCSYIDFFEVVKLVDGEIAGTYRNNLRCDEGSITDEEHDALRYMFGELESIVEKIVNSSRRDLIASTLPEHLDLCYVRGYYVVTGFESAEEFDEFLADNPEWSDAAVEKKGGNRLSVIYPDYVEGKGVDLYTEYTEYNDIEVIEPMSREELLADVVEAQYSDDDESNERIATYYAEALDKIDQVGTDELLLIYSDGEAEIVNRYGMHYTNAHDHSCEVCACLSAAF